MRVSLPRRAAAHLADRGAWALRMGALGPNPPTERSREAIKAVKFYSALTAPTAFLPLPGVDIGALVLLQIVMLRRIARVYQVPFSHNIARLIVSSLLLGLPQGISSSIAGATLASLPLLKAVPGFGTVGAGVAMSVLASGSTWALGIVFIEHFESGGTLLDFDVAARRAELQALIADAETTMRPAGASGGWRRLVWWRKPRPMPETAALPLPARADSLEDRLTWWRRREAMAEPVPASRSIWRLVAGWRPRRTA